MSSLPTETESKPVLEEIQDRYKTTRDRLLPTLIEPGDTDMRFVDGDTCPPAEREIRNRSNRVWIDLDEINQYENQVINDIRANKRAIKFSPTGYGANDDTARFYQQKTREIEYRSKAQIAYTTALQNAVWRGFGYLRIKTDWVQPSIGEQPSPEMFQQDLWIEEIVDPNSILPDPDFKRSDLAGINFLYVLQQFTKEEFQRRWKNAKIANFDRVMTPASQGWITDKGVQVAEYWRRTMEPVMTVGLLENAQGQMLVVNIEVLKAERLPEGFEFKRQREIEDSKVTQIITNGVEVLETNDWIGRDIPFVGCFGKMLYRNKGQGSQRVVHSMTRLAQPAAQMMSYTATAQAELTRQVPKFPYFFYEGSLSPEALDLLQKSYDEPVVGIPVKHTIDGYTAQPLGFPQRAPWEPPIAALEAQKESYRRSIQAAMGMTFLPTQAQNRNEKSGKALAQIESSSQKGAYHFVDSFNLMVERTGVILEDLLDRVLIGERDVSVIDDEDQSMTVRINTQQQGDGNLSSIKGRHSVTVSVGPSDESGRQEADDFVDTLVGTPEILALAQQPSTGPAKIVGQAVRLKNLGPIGDKIADIYDPQKEEGDGPDPQAMMAEIERRGQMLEQASQKIQELESGIAAKQIETQSREKIAEQNNLVKAEIAKMQAEQKERDSERQAAVDLQLQRMEDTIKRAELAMKAAQLMAGQRHDQAMAEQGHQRQMEAGEVSHQHSMESQTQAERSAAASQSTEE